MLSNIIKSGQNIQLLITLPRPPSREEGTFLSPLRGIKEG